MSEPVRFGVLRHASAGGHAGGRAFSLGEPAAPPAFPAAGPPSARLTLPLGALFAVAAGLVVIVGRDGSPVWQVVRTLTVVALGAVGARVLARGRLGQQLAVALLTALVAVPVGLGFGGPHLVKHGLTVASVAGVLVLGGGLALFGTALAATTRIARLPVRIPAWIGQTVALLLMCLTLGQAVAATNVPRPTVGQRTPADAGLTYEEASFPASDGVTLSGWYVPTRNGAAVALLPGAGSTRSDVLDHAVVLASHGFGVLLFDARGHGRSEGRAMDFGWYGDADIAGAITFLAARPDVDAERLAVVGMSMGGEQAIGAAATNPAIRAVVAEGATYRVVGDTEWLSEAYGTRGAISELVGVLTTRFTDLLTSAEPPVTLHDAAASGTPMLLIAGGDVADEAHAGRYIRSASPDTVELWIAPDTPHTGALRTHPAEWNARVVGFLERTLGLTG